MNKLQVNEHTGFLESKSPNLLSFDSYKKVKMLEKARELATSGVHPRTTELCDMFEVSIRTFYEHLAMDDAFKAAWNELSLFIEDHIVSAMVENAKKPQGTTDRIFWLKNRFPEKWNENYHLQISQDSASNKKIIDALPSYIEAEIVDKPGNTDQKAG